MLRFYRYIPAVPKVPPAPRAKSVKIAARNTTSTVTYGARGRLTATARTPADARTPTATQLRTQAAAATAARPASARERAPLAEGGTTAITTGKIRRTPPLATARTASFACAAAYKVPQAVPVAQQPAPPKRSVRCVRWNTAKKTQTTMLWSIAQQKPPPVRNPAGTLTKAAPAAVAAIPLIEKSPR